MYSDKEWETSVSILVAVTILYTVNTAIHIYLRPTLLRDSTQYS